MVGFFLVSLKLDLYKLGVLKRMPFRSRLELSTRSVIAALKTGYASIGYERGRNTLVDLRTFLVNKRMIIPEGKGWRYNPDFVF